MKSKMIMAFEEKYGSLEDHGSKNEYLELLGAFTVGWQSHRKAVEQGVVADVGTSEAIIKDVHDFIIEEFFEVSRAELADLDRFLRERLHS